MQLFPLQVLVASLGPTLSQYFVVHTHTDTDQPASPDPPTPA